MNVAGLHKYGFTSGLRVTVWLPTLNRQPVWSLRVPHLWHGASHNQYTYSSCDVVYVGYWYASPLIPNGSLPPPAFHSGMQVHSECMHTHTHTLLVDSLGLNYL